MPANDLHKQDCLECESEGVTKADFEAIIAKAQRLFGPVVAAHGAELNITGLWTNSQVNASAEQTGTAWDVTMYGGMARRPEISADGFTFVLCHEIGHHLGGFPFATSFGSTATWAANEGQADYFASHVCPALWWGNETAANAAARAAAPQPIKDQCDAVWPTQKEQNLCYRSALAAKTISDILAALGGSREVSFDRKDPKEVARTDHSHPAAQCRLDTYIAGALCAADWDLSLIPGKVESLGDNSRRGEQASDPYNCTQFGQYTAGLRPRCWFKPAL